MTALLYVKSILAGVIAVLLFVLLAILSLLGWQYWNVYRLVHDTNASDSFFINSPWVDWRPLYGAALLIFAAGFWWQFRRASRKNRLGR